MSAPASSSVGARRQACLLRLAIAPRYNFDLNWPVKLSASSTAKPRKPPSDSIGVWQRKSGRFTAIVYVKDTMIYVGTWPTKAEAAVARDRAVLYFGLEHTPLLLGTISRKLGKASPAELIREARLELNQSQTSKFHGVQKAPDGRPGWKAGITVAGNKRELFLGQWKNERDAALAHDRAVLFYALANRQLNFPELRKTLKSADAATLAGEAHRLFKTRTTSRFVGVCLSRGRWTAGIVHRGKRHHLGTFERETQAARAYDEAAIRMHGSRAKLNFHPDTNEELGGRLVKGL